MKQISVTIFSIVVLLLAASNCIYANGKLAAHFSALTQKQSPTQVLDVCTSNPNAEIEGAVIQTSVPSISVVDKKLHLHGLHTFSTSCANIISGKQQTDGAASECYTNVLLLIFPHHYFW